MSTHSMIKFTTADICPLLSFPTDTLLTKKTPPKQKTKTKYNPNPTNPGLKHKYKYLNSRFVLLNPPCNTSCS